MAETKIVQVILDARKDEQGVKSIMLHGVFDETAKIDMSRFEPNVCVKKIRMNLYAPTPQKTFAVVGDQHIQVASLTNDVKIARNEAENHKLAHENVIKQRDAIQKDNLRLSANIDKEIEKGEENRKKVQELSQKNQELTISEKNLLQEKENMQQLLTEAQSKIEKLEKTIKSEREINERHKTNVTQLTYEVESLKTQISKLQSQDESEKK